MQGAILGNASNRFMIGFLFDAAQVKAAVDLVKTDMPNGCAGWQVARFNRMSGRAFPAVRRSHES